MAGVVERDGAFVASGPEFSMEAMRRHRVEKSRRVQVKAFVWVSSL
jgi:hypothetical protein